MYMRKRAVQKKISDAKDKLKLKYGDILPDELVDLFSLIKLIIENRITIKD